MTGRIDIHDPLTEICERLGLDPKYVARIEIRPRQVNATIFQGRNGRFLGDKFVDETGEAATEEFVAEVAT